MSHVHQSVLDDVGALVLYGSADAVVQLADDRHQLRNCFFQERDRPFFQGLCQNGVVCVGTYFGNDGDRFIH